MVGVFAAAIAALGGSHGTATAGELFNRPYVISSIATPSGHDPIRDGSEVEVWFSRHKTNAGGIARSMGWNAHCNTSGGPVRISARRLIPKETAGTLLGCEAAAEREDEWLWHFFSARARWSTRRGHLTLSTPFATMRLRPGTAPPGPP